MKKILVPCDFSKAATNAFRFAVDVAEQSGGAVHLLHVVELPVLHDTVLMPVLNFEQELLKELRAKAEDQFKKLIQKYGDRAKDLTYRVDFGSVSNVIRNYITEHEIDLVCMGSHGASGFREWMIGSNAEKIVRISSAPVLVMKDYVKGPIKNIVFPNTLDTEDQEALVLHVKRLQHFFKAHLHIVWVNTPLNFTPDYITLDRLNAFAKRYMLKDYAISIFNDLDIEHGVTAFSKSIKADMIAMGTHGRTGISHLINGSIAENVVNHNQGIVWTYAMKQEPVESV